MIVAMTEKSQDFSRIVETLLQGDEIPLAMYSDECTPGNPLQPDPSRKITMFYMAPLSKEACRNEDTWFTFSAIRQRCLKDIPGGMSTVLHALLQHLARTNVPQLLKVGQTKKLITYSVAFMIADESALHSMLGCKGSAGRKPCYRCSSVVSKLCRRQLAEHMDDSFQSLEHPNLNNVMRNSDADIWEMIEGLERAKAEMTKGAPAESEKNGRTELGAKFLFAQWCFEVHAASQSVFV